MSEPIKPFAWLVIDKEDGCEYGNMHPDYGRDCCHEHIKDAQEAGIPHARRWVVREVFSREQVEQATAELRAERDALYRANIEATAAYDYWLTESKERGQKAEAERDALKQRLQLHDACNGVMGERGYVPECISLRAERDALRADAERYRWLASRAHKKTSYDRYGNGAHWSIGFFSDDSRHALDAVIDAALKEVK